MAYFRCAFSNSGATLTVECDSFMAGAIVTCSNGVKTLQGLCPSTSPYEVTFKIPEEGTWVVSTTISGATYSTSIDIDFSFEASLSGFNWMRWLTEGGLDPSDYNDLSEVLADEKALRQLNLVHASVDYMSSIIATHPDVETIIAEGLFAKWANLSDYALDHMEANAVLSDLMDDADLYGYGELIEDNGDYVPKGNVPVMTSNSAPYGMASASSVDSATYDAYKAFDGLDSTDWRSGTSGTSNLGRIIYKFLNPVEVTKVEHLSDGIASEYKVQYSDDGTNWTDVLDSTYNTIQGEKVAKTFSKNGFHLYWCSSHVSSPSNTRAMAKTLQFYGRELTKFTKLTPNMTSNTTPSGEVSASSSWDQTNWAPWHAFNDNDNVGNWTSRGFAAGEWLQYKFDEAKVVDYLSIRIGRTFNSTTTFSLTLKGSNDNGSTFVDLGTRSFSIGYSEYNYGNFHFDNETPYQLYRIVFNTPVSIDNQNQNHVVWVKLCKAESNYSEKEFANDGSKWLYDHGVELETINKSQGGLDENSDSILLTKSSQYMPQLYTDKLNLTDYGYVVTKANTKMYKASSTEFFSVSINENAEIDSTNRVAITDSTSKDCYLDISAISQSKRVCVFINSANGNYAQISELWLE